MQTGQIILTSLGGDISPPNPQTIPSVSIPSQSQSHLSTVTDTVKLLLETYKITYTITLKITAIACQIDTKLSPKITQETPYEEIVSKSKKAETEKSPNEKSETKERNKIQTSHCETTKNKIKDSTDSSYKALFNDDDTDNSNSSSDNLDILN